MLKCSMVYTILLMMGSILQALPPKWEEVAARFYERECGNKYEHLAFWSVKEAFPSFGIAHFIWIPKGVDVPFEDLFPRVLLYLEDQGIHLPGWLDPKRDCPWPTREAFYKDEKRLKELRELLFATRELQVRFIAEHFSKTLQEIEIFHPECTLAIQELSKTQKGFYAMCDYSHFKGTGLKPNERYNGYGWGLLQVFQEMERSKSYDLSAFVLSAKNVLQRRVEHSPKGREEGRFLEGWLNRVKGYL